ncbi:hypothetical protein ColLi_02322 [Colletotrichum liriopes]|uniref:Secreted protein n=1 Tax=Colletotrichum liriopes TaxID=708192 RepID=A0AA37GEK1_9PEZI|nr:hypothetical protein ColLi_02322 [Colletotrichum liriopes]
MLVDIAILITFRWAGRVCAARVKKESHSGGSRPPTTCHGDQDTSSMRRLYEYPELLAVGRMYVPLSIRVKLGVRLKR